MKNFKTLWLSFVLIFVAGETELFSQVPIFQRETNTIPVIINNETMYDALRGGFRGSISPAFVDIDGDDDQDLFVGDLSGYISYYRNEGSATKPNYRLVTDRLISDSGTPIAVGSYSAPAFADIDGNGTHDLFIGEKDGSIDYYNNIGTPTAYRFKFQTTQFAGIKLVEFSTPTFMNDDDDKDLDLFVGGNDGKITRYLNTGTVNKHEFIAVGTKYDFGSIRVESNSAPTLYDVDGDKDLDIIVGAFNGGLCFWQREVDGSFIFKECFEDVGFDSKPALVDIDNDGKVDLFVGKSGVDSNINFYRNNGEAFPRRGISHF